MRDQNEMESMIRDALRDFKPDSKRWDEIWGNIRGKRAESAARGRRRHMEKIIATYAGAAAVFVLSITVGVGLWSQLSAGNQPVETSTWNSHNSNDPYVEKVIRGDKEGVASLDVGDKERVFRIHNDELDGQDAFAVYQEVGSNPNVFVMIGEQMNPLNYSAIGCGEEVTTKTTVSALDVQDAAIADLDGDGRTELILAAYTRFEHESEVKGKVSTNSYKQIFFWVIDQNGKTKELDSNEKSDFAFGSFTDGALEVCHANLVKSTVGDAVKQGSFETVLNVVPAKCGIVYHTGNYYTYEKLADPEPVEDPEPITDPEPMTAEKKLWGDKEGVEAFAALPRVRIDDTTNIFRIHNDALDAQDTFEIYQRMDDGYPRIIVLLDGEYDLWLTRSVVGSYALQNVFTEIEAIKVLDAVFADLNADGRQELILSTLTHYERKSNRDGAVETSFDRVFFWVIDQKERTVLEIDSHEDLPVLAFGNVPGNTAEIYDARIQSSSEDTAVENGGFETVIERVRKSGSLIYTDFYDYQKLSVPESDISAKAPWGDQEGVPEILEHKNFPSVFRNGVICRVHNEALDGQSDYQVYQVFGEHPGILVYSTRTGILSSLNINEEFTIEEAVEEYGYSATTDLYDAMTADLDGDGVEELFLLTKFFYSYYPSYYGRGDLKEIEITYLRIFNGYETPVQSVECVGEEILLFGIVNGNTISLYSGTLTASDADSVAQNEGCFKKFYAVDGNSGFLTCSGTAYYYHGNPAYVPPVTEPKPTDPPATDRAPSEGLAYKLNGRSYIVVGIGSCTDQDVVIPATYNGKPVESIEEYAFEGCNQLKSVFIPDSVKSIGRGAFFDCRELTSVRLPDGITCIDQDTFLYCTSLKSIRIPDSVTIIWSDAFGNCSSLTSINIPDGITRIEDLVFSNTGLTSVTIPDGVTYIGIQAFAGCENLTAITIPDSVTRIGDSAFSGCSGLTRITIPDSVTYIGTSAFSYCTGLTGITIPDSVTGTGPFVFDWCTALTSVTLSKNMTAIEMGFFSYCTALKSITIPDNIKEIKSSAFDRCTSLTSITIPDSVTSIESGAFSNCTGLKRITLPSNITTLEDSLFFGCTGLTSITIPDSVTSIGRSVFNGCTALTSITLGKNVESISDNPFNGCTSLTSITMFNRVRTITNRSFLGCTALTSIHYVGTKAEWNAIVKRGGWEHDILGCVVRCTDGDIQLGEE